MKKRYAKVGPYRIVVSPSEEPDFRILVREDYGWDEVARGSFAVIGCQVDYTVYNMRVDDMLYLTRPELEFGKALTAAHRLASECLRREG